MDLRDLAYFEAIAEAGNLSEAARRVFRSQPALSKCLQRLEAGLNAPLFERNGRRLRLTPVGEALLARARMLRRAMEDTVRELGDIAQGLAGHVRIGHTATAAEYLLPQIVSAVRRQAPRVTLELVLGLNDPLRAALRAGDLDLLVGPLTELDAEFETLTIFKDEVVVAAGKDHPLCRIARPSLAQLAQFGWVLPPHSVSIRGWLDRAFERRRLPHPRVEVESGLVTLMPGLVERTDLLTFVSRQHLRGRNLRPLLREIHAPELLLRREFGAVFPVGGCPAPSAQAVLGVLRSRKNRLSLVAPG
ncbi:LysR family transcriptional regulator [Pigmentiphaga soli]|uniref:LysR family transcriptional regulator n=1 Tax=Pigmentiphaga soli TaxID=1007095 RepID=A0ABP8GNW6_9BURK